MTNPFDTAVTKADLEDKAKRRHYVTIYVRGCDTTRDCYCLNTNGRDHTEYESSWVVDMEGNYERGGKEKPLAIPFRTGEDLEDYRDRLVRITVWDECYDALTGVYSDWINPDDLLPNLNPYRD